MEIATLCGILASCGVLLGGILFAGGNPLGFIDPAAGLIIGGGVFCVVLTSFSIDEFMRLPTVAKNIFFYTKPDLLSVVNTLVELSNQARRSGILTLDAQLPELNDSFLASGLRMAIDGMPPEVVASIMEREIEAINGRHAIGAEMVSTLGRVAPVFGLIATLLGLILMLAHMDPKTVGEHMSVALTGTLYGISSANLFFLPFASKLRYFNKQEVLAMELKMYGVLAILGGESPRAVKTKLMVYVPDRLRPQEDPNE